MEKKIEKIKKFRIFLLQQLKDLSVQQLNQIPSGYSNNIIWNLGHMTAAMQNMTYVKSGQAITVADEYFTPFLSGTKPVAFIYEPAVNAIKAALINSADRLQQDYEQGLFDRYQPSEKILQVYGFGVNNIDEALEYILYHDGLHSGYINALKRLV